MNLIEIWYPQSWTFNVECWREVVRIFDRMLERRVSNQRQDLSSDQQMNYLLSWFVNWSDLQKVGQPSICLRCWQWWHWWTTCSPASSTNLTSLSQEDFVPILAEKMSNKWATGDNLSKLFHSFFEMTPSSSPVSKFKMAISRTLIHFNAILWNV